MTDDLINNLDKRRVSERDEHRKTRSGKDRSSPIRPKSSGKFGDGENTKSNEFNTTRVTHKSDIEPEDVVQHP